MGCVDMVLKRGLRGMSAVSFHAPLNATIGGVHVLVQRGIMEPENAAG